MVALPERLPAAILRRASVRRLPPTPAPAQLRGGHRRARPVAIFLPERSPPFPTHTEPGHPVHLPCTVASYEPVVVGVRPVATFYSSANSNSSKPCTPRSSATRRTASRTPGINDRRSTKS